MGKVIIFCDRQTNKTFLLYIDLLLIRIQSQVCPLPNPKPVPANRPNLEAKRPPKPLIVTSLCKLNTKSCLNQVSCGGEREEKRNNISLSQVSLSYATAKDGTKHMVSVYLGENKT